MKYDILKDFKGSQDGRITESFTAGTQAELSDYLASCISPDMARPVSVKIENKAVIEDGEETPRRGRPFSTTAWISGQLSTSVRTNTIP